MDAFLEAVKRDTFGKNLARQLRRQGRLPAIFYGGGASEAGTRTAMPIAVDPKSLMRILHSESGANTLITLKVTGEPDTKVMLKEFQLDPVTHHLLHADFYRVAMDRLITVTVPLVIKGEAPGVKQQGGLLDFVHREIDVECLPGDIPEHIEIDVSSLMLGQVVRLRDLVETTAWRAKADPSLVLVHVVAPKAAAEPEPAEAPVEAAAEPEVIKKGKAEKVEGEKEQ